MPAIWKTLKPGPDPPHIVYAIVEIPKGSNVKYEIDHETGFIFVDRILQTAFAYPFDYGIIPQTWFMDKDPLDIMVLSQTSIFPGCVVPARPVALIHTRDEKGSDDKVLAVPTTEPGYEEVKNVDDVAPSILAEIKHFLEHYKELEAGKWVKVMGWEGAEAAKKVIMMAIGMYQERFDTRRAVKAKLGRTRMA